MDGWERRCHVDIVDGEQVAVKEEQRGEGIREVKNAEYKVR